MGKLGQHFRSQFVGYLALFVALGGVSYAAVKLPNNSVQARQIAKNAVGSSEVRDGSLGCAKLAGGARRACARVRGYSKVAIRRKTVKFSLTCSSNGFGGLFCTSAQKAVTAKCKRGETAISGGYAGTASRTTSPSSDADVGSINRPQPLKGKPTQWTASASGFGSSSNTTKPPNPSFTTYVVCAS